MRAVRDARVLQDDAVKRASSSKADRPPTRGASLKLSTSTDAKPVLRDPSAGKVKFTAKKPKIASQGASAPQTEKNIELLSVEADVTPQHKHRSKARSDRSVAKRKRKSLVTLSDSSDAEDPPDQEDEEDEAVKTSTPTSRSSFSETQVAPLPCTLALGDTAADIPTHSIESPWPAQPPPSAHVDKATAAPPKDKDKARAPRVSESDLASHRDSIVHMDEQHFRDTYAGLCMCPCCDWRMCLCICLCLYLHVTLCRGHQYLPPAGDAQEAQRSTLPGAQPAIRTQAQHWAEPHQEKVGRDFPVL